jgi:hypothetical protein
MFAPMRIWRTVLLTVGAFVALASPAQAYLTLFPDCVAKSDTDIHGRFGLYPFNLYSPVEAGFYAFVRDSAGNPVESTYRDVGLKYTSGAGAGEYSFTLTPAANLAAGAYSVTAEGDTGGGIASESATLKVGGCDSTLFGTTTPGASFSGMSANAKRASPFTLFAPATVRRLNVYIDGKGASSGSQKIRAVLYRNASGGPAAYVARSFEFTVPAGMSGRWVPLYLAPPAQLNPGVYWVGLQSDATNGVARFAWSSKPGSRRSNVDGYADGPSDPFGTAALDDQQMSIYASGSY